MRHGIRIPLSLLAVAGLVGCGHDRAAVTVELRDPVASQFVVHGNCFSSWLLDAGLVLHETNGVDVMLETVTLRVADARDGSLLGEDNVDAATLRDRSGPDADVLRAGAALLVPLGIHLPGPVEAPAFSGSVAVSGQVRGHDANGEPLDVSYAFTTPVTIKGGPLGNGGGCGSS